MTSSGNNERYQDSTLNPKGRQGKLAVLTSGQGRVLASLIEACQSDKAPVQIVGVIGSRALIGATKLAEAHGIPTATIDRKHHSSFEEWDLAVCDQLKSWESEWVLLSGFLAKIGPRVLETYQERVINSHPSLLPAYGGKGMYGRRVHEAVLAAKEKVTGVTIHFVNAKYDEGPIIAQRECLVQTTDTAESLEQRVVAMEKQFVVETVLSLCGH